MLVFVTVNFTELHLPDGNLNNYAGFSPIPEQCNKQTF